MRTLLLNADYSPFDVVSYRKAIVMVYCDGSAYSISEYAKTIRDSKEREYPIPAVVVLKDYVSSANKQAPYNKLNVYARDRFICQYCYCKCSRETATIDHVIPRSKWKGAGSCTNFHNVVTACKKCNAKKGDKTLEAAGMKLHVKPAGMTRRESLHNKLQCLAIPPEWKPYVTQKQAL